MRLIGYKARTGLFFFGLGCLFLLVLSAQARAQTVLSASFNTSSDGFVYSDDKFRGTNQPSFASGDYDSGGGFSGGGLHVKIGDVNTTDITNGMSGGWSKSFNVSSGGMVSITLRYRLKVSGDNEPDECGQALVSVDGTLVSPGSNSFLEQFCGMGDGNPAQDSGWQQVTMGVSLSGGTHTIAVGGWNNKKTSGTEVTDVFFDDIVIVEGDSPSPTPTPTPTPTPNPGTIFSDDFSDGNTNGWTVVNDSGKTSSWNVANGRYTQLNDKLDKFLQSFHLGSYSFYQDGFGLSSYELSLIIKPLTGVNESRDTVGIMFRYKDRNNYYRFSMSRKQGFSSLEKRVNGKFTTLAYNGRGFISGQDLGVIINVDGSKILVYVNGEPLFSAMDSSLSSCGICSVALFTQSKVEFDNVVVKTNSSTPKVIISSLTSYSVEPTSALAVSAVARNVPSGGGVKFVLDNGASFIDFSEPYSYQFSGVSQGDHTVDAIIVNSSGVPVSGTMAKDTNVVIGVEGEYFVAMGDSITNGHGDNFSGDNDSLNGRNLNRGFTPILNDCLSGELNKPITVMNEGLGGTTSKHGRNRLKSTKARHIKSEYWLILFGTNDSSGSMPVLSGINCTEAQINNNDSNCVGTYKYNMTKIIKDLKSSGKFPLLGKVPFAKNASSSKDSLIREYNLVIEDLVAEHNIQKPFQPVLLTPPDFYTHFKNHQEELSDNLHPNGDGYISMATLWCDAL